MGGVQKKHLLLSKRKNYYHHPSKISFKQEKWSEN